jgi:hypothetical protein
MSLGNLLQLGLCVRVCVCVCFQEVQKLCFNGFFNFLGDWGFHGVCVWVGFFFLEILFILMPTCEALIVQSLSGSNVAVD